MMITPKLYMSGDSLADEQGEPWFCLELLKELVNVPKAYIYWGELTSYPARGSMKVQLRHGIYYPRYRFNKSVGNVFLPALDKPLSFLANEWKDYYFRLWYQ